MAAHTVLLLVATHSVTASGHTHNVTASGHTHNVTVSGHTHNVTASGRTHSVTAFLHVAVAPVENQDDTEFMYEARVDIKRFSHLLASQIQSNKVICSKIIAFSTIKEYRHLHY